MVIPENLMTLIRKQSPIIPHPQEAITAFILVCQSRLRECVLVLKMEFYGVFYKMFFHLIYKATFIVTCIFQ